MREMKDSGIEWLGVIPADWEVKKIKFTLQERIEKNNPIRTSEILSLTAKQGVVPHSEKEGGGNKPKEDLSDYRLAYPGDIVMNSMNILSGSVGLSKYFGCVSPVYYMLRPREKNHDVRYYNYVFQTTIFQKSLFGLGNGILIKESGNGKLNTIRMRIPMDKFGNVFIPVAPVSYQKTVSDYLDSICSEIDSIMSDLQTQIDNLEEYKRSVITEAVTKGLDPDVEMRESGIDTFDFIPKHWEVLKIKWLLRERNERSVSGEEEPLSMSQKFGIIPTSQMDIIPNMASSFVGAKITHIDDLVFNKLKAHLGVFAVSKYYGLVSPDYAVYFTSGKSIVKYLEFLFKTDNCISEFKRRSTGVGAGLTRLYTSDLFDIKVPIPPISEQMEIAKHLDCKISEINLAISEKHQQIETIEEYKKSLIFEYVTGKKEVVNE